MTIQKEIKAVMVDLFASEKLADTALEFLHSQGVVIKKQKELEAIPPQTRRYEISYEPLIEVKDV